MSSEAYIRSKLRVEEVASEAIQEYKKRFLEEPSHYSIRGKWSLEFMIGLMDFVLERGKKTGINVYTCANVTMDMAGKELTPMEELIKAGAVLFYLKRSFPPSPRQRSLRSLLPRGLSRGYRGRLHFLRRRPYRPFLSGSSR